MTQPHTTQDYFATAETVLAAAQKATQEYDDVGIERVRNALVALAAGDANRALGITGQDARLLAVMIQASMSLVDAMTVAAVDAQRAKESSERVN